MEEPIKESRLRSPWFQLHSLVHRVPRGPRDVMPQMGGISSALLLRRTCSGCIGRIECPRCLRGFALSRYYLDSHRLAPLFIALFVRSVRDRKVQKRISNSSLGVALSPSFLSRMKLLWPIVIPFPFFFFRFYYLSGCVSCHRFNGKAILVLTCA